jgi:hypothetical protein
VRRQAGRSKNRTKQKTVWWGDKQIKEQNETKNCIMNIQTGRSKSRTVQKLLLKFKEKFTVVIKTLQLMAFGMSTIKSSLFLNNFSHTLLHIKILTTLTL